MKSDRLKTLYLVRNLSFNPMTTRELKNALSIVNSDMLHCYISSARKLGAIITYNKCNEQWVYRLENSDAVQNTLNTWIRLEESLDLTIDDFARPYKK